MQFYECRRIGSVRSGSPVNNEVVLDLDISACALNELYDCELATSCCLNSIVVEFQVYNTVSFRTDYTRGLSLNAVKYVVVDLPILIGSCVPVIGVAPVCDPPSSSIKIVMINFDVVHAQFESIIADRGIIKDVVVYPNGGPSLGWVV